MLDTSVGAARPQVIHEDAAEPTTADVPGTPVTIIEPLSRWRVLDWRELVAYRDLFVFLVWRDVKVLYAQTVMGFTWAIIRPLTQVILFTIVFGRMAQMPTNGAPYAVFSMVALVPWTYFATAVTSSTQSLISSNNLLTKVYFPRMLIPLTSVVAKLVDLLVSLPLIVVTLLWYRITPTPSAVFIPLLILIMMITAAGVGMWLSALAVQYRDVKHAAEFMIQIMMYAAPVVWPASLIEQHFGAGARLVYGIYPMAGVIEGFRAALLGGMPMPWDLIAIGSVSAIASFLFGGFVFRGMEGRFADVA
jgi:lipopolysaccharide transport system permease protein